MKKSALSIVTILAVFTLFGCMGDIEIPCIELEDFQMPDICRFMDKECNMAMSPPSICERMEISEEDCLDYFDGEWEIGSGTCQDLQEVDGPCAEDADCEEGLTCNVDVCA